jgi:hypothetical protein
MRSDWLICFLLSKSIKLFVYIFNDHAFATSNHSNQKCTYVFNDRPGKNYRTGRPHTVVDYVVQYHTVTDDRWAQEHNTTEATGLEETPITALQVD